jgi:hypothetical protein
MDHEIAANPDMHMTYLGYRKFMESDFKYIFPLGKGRSGHSYKRDVKYIAKQKLIRGHVSTSRSVKSTHLVEPWSSLTSNTLLQSLTISHSGFYGRMQVGFPKSFTVFDPSIYR